MKTAKKTLAIILCIATLFSLCVTGASALQTGDTVTWIDEYYEEEMTLPYKGFVQEGDTDFEEVAEDYYCCYEFEATKDGYYKISSPDCVLNSYFAETYTDTTAKNYKDNIYIGYESDDGCYYDSRIYYLEKGLHLLVAQFYSGCDFDTDLTIEYYADTISEVKYDEELLDSVIDGFDDVYVNEYENVITIYSNIEITFSKSGDETTITRGWFECAYDGEIVKGENNVTLVLPGYEKETTITFYDESDFVESIECANANDYLDAIIYYTGYNYGYADLDGLQITVNFTDGTKETVVYDSDSENYVKFPNGKFYWIEAFITVDERVDIGTNKLTLFVSLAWDGKNHVIAECNVTEASFAENFAFFKAEMVDIMEDLSHITNYFSYMIEDGDFAFWTDMFFADLRWCFDRFGEHISLFFSSIF